MSEAAGRRPPTVVILQREGDPFEADALETSPPVERDDHRAILNKIFYDSTVDLGGRVRIDGRTYVCTRAGWRVAEGREGT